MCTILIPASEESQVRMVDQVQWPRRSGATGLISGGQHRGVSSTAGPYVRFEPKSGGCAWLRLRRLRLNARKDWTTLLVTRAVENVSKCAGSPFWAVPARHILGG